MFAFNRRYPFAKKLIIVLFTVPLMFTTGSFLGDLVQEQFVGVVGDFDVPRNEFLHRYNRAAEQYRRLSGVSEISPAIETEIVRATRQGLIEAYLVKTINERKGLRAPDSQVAALIRNDPSLQEDGQFSISLYHQYVSDPAFYEDQVRSDANNTALNTAFDAVAVPQLAEKIASFRRQERIVSAGFIKFADFPNAVAATPEEIEAYYQNNARRYRIDENASFQYFTFSASDLLDTIEVGADDIEDAYQEYIAETESDRRRKISHIYLTDADAADAVYARLEAGEDFATLARAESEDPGSAESGGLLGIFVDGDLPEAMNEAAFNAAPGDIQPPVAVDGGYSIIRIDESISETAQPLAAVRDEIEARARRYAAEIALDDTLAVLGDMAPIEIGSLEALASVVGKTVEFTVSVSSDPEKNGYPFDSEGVIAETFDSFIVTDLENSAPIAIDDKNYLVVRALQHIPARQQSLDEVAGRIDDSLRTFKMAATMYVRTNVDGGDGDFGALIDDIAWSAPQTVVLAQVQDEAEFIGEAEEGALSDTDIDEIYSTPILGKLPSYVFIPQTDEGGLRVIRINNIVHNAPLDEDYQVIDSLVERQATRLGELGYLQEISDEFNYEFYDEPETAVREQTLVPVAPQQ